MLDGNEIIVLSKDEGRELLVLIRRLAESDMLEDEMGRYSMDELNAYSSYNCLGLVIRLAELVKGESDGLRC